MPDIPSCFCFGWREHRGGRACKCAVGTHIEVDRERRTPATTSPFPAAGAQTGHGVWGQGDIIPLNMDFLMPFYFNSIVRGHEGSFFVFFLDVQIPFFLFFLIPYVTDTFILLQVERPIIRQNRPGRPAKNRRRRII